MAKPHPGSSSPKVLDFYRSTKERIMQQIFSNCECSKEFVDRPALLRSKLPLFYVERAQEHPLGVSMYLLSKERDGLSHYFFTQCSTALLPGHITPLERFFSSNVRLEGFDGALTLIEAYVVFQTQSAFVLFNENLDRFMEEVRRGCEKQDVLERILERKRGGANRVYLLLQDLLEPLKNRFSFSSHLMEKFLRRFWVEFNERIEGAPLEKKWKKWFVRYVFLQKQIRNFEEGPAVEKEHKVQVFFIGAKEDRKTLGLALYLPLAPNEVFELKHLKKSLQLIHPSIDVDESSFVRLHHDSIFLVEIKTHLERFEIERGLRFTLTSSIERYVHQVFMPRNEEDVMRRIVTLCNEISSKEDIPQVAIHFERQYESYLSYLVLIVKPYDTTPIERLTAIRKQGIGVHLEATRRFYQKLVEIEASTVRIDIDLKGFIRADHSIDSLKVRAHITDFLKKIFPNFRDYNGGMISKQIDNLRLFKGLLKDHDETYLENFFLSLQPVEIQYLAKLDPLLEMFHFFMSGSKQLTGEHLIKKGNDGVLILASLNIASKIDAAAKACVKTKFEWIRANVLIWGKSFHLFYLYQPQLDTMQKFDKMMNEIFLERIDRGVIT
ncbi:MAG: hypothetical protein FJZ61_02975 [Chlamydiae bacterium]|nr:hypothetical protein [Chlamydiota bacterium]